MDCEVESGENEVFLLADEFTGEFIVGYFRVESGDRNRMYLFILTSYEHASYSN